MGEQKSQREMALRYAELTHKLGAEEADRVFRREQFEQKKTGDAAEMDYRGKQLAETGRHNKASEGIDRIRANKEKGGGLSLNIAPGWVNDPSIKTSDKEKSDFRNALATKDEVVSQVRALREMISKNGSMTYGPDSAKAASLASSIKLKIKDLAKLGALSGSDLALLQSQVPDPSSKASLLTGNDTMTSALDQLEGQLDANVNASARSMGFHRSGETSQPAQASPLPPEKAARLAELRRKRDAMVRR
jgi:hypothetical protein